MSKSFAISVLLLLLPPLLVVSNKDANSIASDGNLKPFGQQGPSQSIDSVDGYISPEDFLTNYVQKNRPMLMRGAAKVSPAFEKWTDAYLWTNAPPRPAGDVFIEHNKKENRSHGSAFIHFKKFLEIYNTSDIYMVSEVPAFMLRDLIVPYPVQCKYFVKGGLDTHVAWFSSGGTSSVIHLDSYENINCLLRGRKSLVMLNTTRFEAQVQKILDQPDQSHSSADVDAIDIEARPEFSGLEFHTAKMQAGDCLYIPNLWVHQVRSYENNLAVNLWWFNRSSYDLSGCGKQFDKSLTWDRVAFAARVKAARDDAYSVRETLRSYLKPPVTLPQFLYFLSRGNAKELSTSWPDFPRTVEALFLALDINKDNKLTQEEFETKLKLKTGVEIKAAVTAYNVQVFAMHQAAQADVSKLPKLLATSDSGEEMFTQESTWLTPEPEQMKDEIDASTEVKEEL